GLEDLIEKLLWGDIGDRLGMGTDEIAGQDEREPGWGIVILREGEGNLGAQCELRDLGGGGMAAIFPRRGDAGFTASKRSVRMERAAMFLQKWTGNPGGKVIAIELVLLIGGEGVAIFQALEEAEIVEGFACVIEAIENARGVLRRKLVHKVEEEVSFG